MARKEWAEVVVEEDTAELGVVNEEAVMGVVEVMAVAVEVDVDAAVLGTVVMVEGVVREVGGVASRSSTQSNCIPSSLNTRMTGSPRTNRMLSAGMENGKHSRAVATEAVDLADSTAWGAIAADYEAGPDKGEDKLTTESRSQCSRCRGCRL